MSGASADPVSAEDIRSLVEAYEAIDRCKAGLSRNQAEILQKAEGRYDIDAFFDIIALRKQDPCKVAEHEAVVDLYRKALGMI